MNVQQFLTQCEVPFETMDHQPTYDAQSLALAVQAPAEEVAKAVLLRVDEDYMLAVLPASRDMDLTKLKDALLVEVADFASEDECGRHFSDCELGALPPFGSRYGMKTVVDQSLAKYEEFIFEGNTHQEAIRMKFADYEILEQPLISDFSEELAEGG